MKKIISSFTLGSVLATQMGCSTIIASYDNKAHINNERSNAMDIMSTKAVKNEFIHEKKGIYVNKTPLRVSDQKNQLLSAYSGNILISSKTPMPMREVADRIAKISGLSVNYSDPIVNQMMSGQTNQSQSSMTPNSVGADGFPSLSGLGLTNGALTSLSGDNMGFPSDVVPIDANFNGKLTDFLDHVAGRTGLSWRYESMDRRIVFYKYETKTFPIYVMPGTLDMKATLSNTTSSGGTAGGANSGNSNNSSSGQETVLTTSVKVWDDTVKSIEKMLSKYGRLNGNEAIGTITVTDTPPVLATISRYIDQTNQAMARQVSFDVAIYDVTLDKSNKAGIDWNFVWSEAQKYGIGYGAASATATTIANGSGLVFGGAGASMGDLRGSSAVIKALETQGNVALRAKHQAVTLNNTPVPIKVADETTYLASSGSGSTNTGAGNAQPGGVLTTSLTPGKVVTGLTMTLLPRVFDANQMSLQMSLDLSNLKDITTITSGTQSIQAPRVGAKSFIQRVALKNDQTLIMSGFDQDKRSMGTDSSLDIPGGLSAGDNHVITVVLVKPRITEGVTGL